MPSKYNPDKHHRQSIRFKGYDYAQPGSYFITICTHNREHLFGDVVDGVMVLNEWGQRVEMEWFKTPTIRPNIVLDEFVVMPNHIHGIVAIGGEHEHVPGNDVGRRGVLQYAPTDIPSPMQQPWHSPSQTIGAIIRGFKSATTKRINEIRQTPGITIWQRNYYDHIIRNEHALQRIRQYIKNNPMEWESDDLF